MRIAYLDCFSGISGDMFLGALIDAGVPVHLFEETVAQLKLGARLEVRRVDRSGISATKVDVWTGDEKDMPREESWRVRRDQKVHQHLHDDHSEPSHHHHHDHESDPEHEELPKQHSHDHQHGRTLVEIRKIIQQADISETAKQKALRTFELLGAAEAKIHNREIDNIHFHEVGSVDAIVDIVCAAVGSEALNITQWHCSPLNVGGGTVECAHGRFPVPAPATVELLKEAPIYSSGIQKELVTPTGAAIVQSLITQFGSFPSMKIDSTGYGAGSRDLPGHANVLRITVGETANPSNSATPELVTVLEANVDDMNPQVFGYVMERLLAEGALDVFGSPVQMKKNRPGLLLTVLVKNEDALRLTDLIFAETTTIGVRMREERRQVLARRSVSVKTEWGDIRIKIAEKDGNISNFAPEFEDCRRIASEHNVPLKTVMQEAVRIYLDQKNG